MKTTGFRSVVLYILLAFFIGGVGYLVVSLFTNGAKWVSQPYNGHIVYGEGTTIDTGTITDRNQIILAETQGEARIYSENGDIRRALLHTVGDTSGYIGTSIQAGLRAKLMGYNIITGLNRTPLSDLGVNNMRLTVDAELCAAAYNALDGKKGAVLLYNYKTGEVLCKVSSPTYDPGDVPQNLLEDADYDGVLLDNTISSAFAPGSIFKIITAGCSMENLSDWEDITYDCEGEVDIGTGVVTCLDSHGTIGIHEAFASSCNVYFALLSERLGAAKMQATAEEMGFNKNFRFQDFSTAKSVVELKAATPLEMGWAGVGQYTVTANPTHFLVLMSAIANGGKITPPRITDSGIFSVFSGDESLMSSRVAANLKIMMRYNVTDHYGDSMFPGMEVCAKTGTAEVGNGKEPTAWIVGFSSNSPYAFSIAVEEGGSGFLCAGSIASELMGMVRER